MSEKLGIINNYNGAIISLNQKKAPYFGVGMDSNGHFKVWLSKQKWCAKIPEGLTSQEADQIKAALWNGTLVEGKKYIPAAEKDPTVLAKYVNHVKNSYVLDNQAKSLIQLLVQKKQDGNYTAVEILAECLRVEESTRRRPTWIAFLNDAIKAYDGPQFIVEDYSDSPDVYQVTIDSNGTVVKDSRPDAKIKALPETNVSKKVRTNELNKFLGEQV